MLKTNIAIAEHAAGISDLLNLAYRGEQGWTTEHTLVAGPRCTPKVIEAELRSPDTHFLIQTRQNQIQACIAIIQCGDSAHIGSFAVAPGQQNQGLGKQLLQQAEHFAKHSLKASRFVMSVLSNRHELMSYYERRGYRRTGRLTPYPLHLNVGRPRDEKQTLEELVKPA